MATRTHLVPVAPPVPQRWRLGLFDLNVVSSLPADIVADRNRGIVYTPDDFDGQALNNQSFDPCEDVTLTPHVINQDDEVSWYSWAINAAERCSSFGDVDGGELQRRAIAKLEAQTNYLGEYTFWTGNVEASTFAGLSWPNRALANAAAVDLTPSDGEAGVVEAFGLINEYLADTLRGLRGVIHVAPQVLPYLAFYGVVIRDGFNLLTTLSDHVVVAGSGYQGTAPDGAAQPDNRSWIYATSMIRTGVGPIDEDATTVQFDRVNNNYTATAIRYVIAEWDLQAHAAVRVCLTDPGPACATAGS